MTGSDDALKRPSFMTEKLGWVLKPDKSKPNSACEHRAFQKRVDKRRKKKGYK